MGHPGPAFGRKSLLHVADPDEGAKCVVECSFERAAEKWSQLKNDGSEKINRNLWSVFCHVSIMMTWQVPRQQNDDVAGYFNDF